MRFSEGAMKVIYEGLLWPHLLIFAVFSEGFAKNLSFSLEKTKNPRNFRGGYCGGTLIFLSLGVNLTDLVNGEERWVWILNGNMALRGSLSSITGTSLILPYFSNVKSHKGLGIQQTPSPHVPPTPGYAFPHLLQPGHS